MIIVTIIGEAGKAQLQAKKYLSVLKLKFITTFHLFFFFFFTSWFFLSSLNETDKQTKTFCVFKLIRRRKR